MTSPSTRRGVDDILHLRRTSFWPYFWLPFDLDPDGPHYGSLFWYGAFGRRISLPVQFHSHPNLISAMGIPAREIPVTNQRAAQGSSQSSVDVDSGTARIRPKMCQSAVRCDL
jgi:hypothetical protein